jgi:hypothetical protein
MGYLDPPEPDAEGTDTFTCSREVERKFVTPEMEQHLTILRDGPKVPEPWAATRDPEVVAQLVERARVRAVDNLLRAWKDAEEFTGTCGWSGEADYEVWHGSICWTCPSCGEDHDDESAEDRWGPDPDYYKEMAAEMAFDQMREDAVLDRLREDEAGLS